MLMPFKPDPFVFPERLEVAGLLEQRQPGDGAVERMINQTARRVAGLRGAWGKG